MIFSRNKIFGVAALLGIIALALGAWRFRHDFSEVNIQKLVDFIANFGPGPFFVAMAILPSLWAPVSPFLLLAGAIYDLPTALGGCAAALAVNMALSWLLAGRLFRPLFERLVHRFGYSVPKMKKQSMLTIAVLLRITPGMPFPLQNYLLGLARMPFGLYMGVSLPLTLVMAFSIILFGDAILKGNMTVVLLAIGLFLTLSLAIRYLRTRLKSKAAMEESS